MKFLPIQVKSSTTPRITRVIFSAGYEWDVRFVFGLCDRPRRLQFKSSTTSRITRVIFPAGYEWDVRFVFGLCVRPWHLLVLIAHFAQKTDISAPLLCGVSSSSDCPHENPAPLWSSDVAVIGCMWYSCHPDSQSAWLGSDQLPPLPPIFSQFMPLLKL